MAVPSGANKGIIIQLYRDSGVTAVTTTTLFSQLQIVKGSFTDVDFCYSGKTIVQELQHCQRYYEKSYDININPGTVTFAGNVAWGGNAGTTTALYTHSRPFAVSKRVAPTITIYSPNTGAQGFIYSEGAPLGDITVGVSDIGQSSFRIWNNTATGYYPHAHFTADAEL